MVIRKDCGSQKRIYGKCAVGVETLTLRIYDLERFEGSGSCLHSRDITHSHIYDRYRVKTLLQSVFECNVRLESMRRLHPGFILLEMDQCTVDIECLAAAATHHPALQKR